MGALSPTGTTTLQPRVSDQFTADSIDAAVVTFTEVSVVPSTETDRSDSTEVGVQVLSDSNFTVDPRDLQEGVAPVLADTETPADVASSLHTTKTYARRVREGDRNAFRVLLERYDGMVFDLTHQYAETPADAALMRTVATRAQNAGFGAQATAGLLRPAVDLAEQDLPAAPLMNKALEGLAKQVPAARMGPVLRQLGTHTREAGRPRGAEDNAPRRGHLFSSLLLASDRRRGRAAPPSVGRGGLSLRLLP